MRADLPPSISASCLVQRGRSRHQRSTAAESVEPGHPFAGMVAVAEGLPGDDRSASLAVSTVRDIFGEGVAYGVGEALADAVEEASERIRDAGLQGCSIAAAAYLGDRIWLAHRGNCRIYRVSRDSAEQVGREHTLAVQMGLGFDSPGFLERSRDLTAHLGERRAAPDTAELRMSPGEAVLLLTAEAWLRLEPGDIASGACGRECLMHLSGKARLRFRRQGGALASVCFLAARRWRLSRRRILGVLPFLLTAAVLAGLVYLTVRLVSCEGSATQEPGPDTTEVVMPLEPTAPADTRPPPPGPELPVSVLVLGEDSLDLAADSFRQTLAGAPDPRWERFEGAVYGLVSDTLMDSLAAGPASAAGIDSFVAVRRIVAVRSDQAAAFSRWLEELEPEAAGSTAVIVETETSVAGGAPWTERYPLFVNGSRELQGEPSGCVGDLPPGIPAIPDSSLYRLVVVPGSLD
ncbi:MAG: hypothetical protein R6U36_10180 [Candidatus Fermentibacteraceae bacterium]